MVYAQMKPFMKTIHETLCSFLAFRDWLWTRAARGWHGWLCPLSPGRAYPYKPGGWLALLYHPRKPGRAGAGARG